MSGLSLIIGNKNYSSWSLRPWFLMKHHELNFHEKRVPLFTETTNDELSEFNSDFKVPVLNDNGLVVWDSLAILEYVSENYLQGRGWPVESQVRAIARSMCSEMHSSFNNVRKEMPMNCRKKFNGFELSSDAVSEVERICSLWRNCRNQHKDKGDWLFGEFTIADAMFAPIVLRFDGYDVFLSGVEGEYSKRVLNHPAIIEWVESGKMETEIIEEDEV